MFRTVTSRAQARASRSGFSSSMTKSFAHTISSQPLTTSYRPASCSSPSSSSSSTAASLQTTRRQSQSARRQQRRQLTTSNPSQPRKSPLTTTPSSSPSPSTFAIAPPSSSSSSYISSPIPRRQGQRQQQGTQRRFFSSSLSSRSDQPTASTAAAGAAEITPDQYHQLADAYIEALLEELEMMQEERAEVDVEYSAGVLKLVFPPAGTYVINKQPPNKQIWLSSPVSGPKRYDWVLEEVVEEEGQEWKQGNWVYLRDGSTLNELLSEELGVETEGLGKEVD